MKNFKWMVKHQLLKKRKSMKDLANQMGISPQLLNSYMAGKVHPNTYKDRVMKALNEL